MKQRTEPASCIIDGCESTRLRMGVDTMILPDGCVETLTWFVCDDHVYVLPGA